MWYEEKYAKDLGVTFNSIWDKKCSVRGNVKTLIQIKTLIVSFLSFKIEEYYGFFSACYNLSTKLSSLVCDIIVNQ